MPHTLTSAILYRAKIDSFNELPKDKRPPRSLWDKPYRLEKFLDHIWDRKDDNTSRPKEFMEFNLEDVE